MSDEIVVADGIEGMTVADAAARDNARRLFRESDERDRDHSLEEWSDE